MNQSRTPFHESGQALVEFALVLPLLLLIVMGILDLGRGIYAYNVVASAAREGARYGITDCNQATSIDSIKNKARQNTAGIEVDPNQIIVTYAVCQHGNPLTVRVSYTFQPVTLFFAPVTVTGQSTMVIQ